MGRQGSLEDLPVELLYDVQLYALSDTLPHVSRRLYHVFKSAPPSFHAQYILGRVLSTTTSASIGTGQMVSRALKYPLCTIRVLDWLCRCTNIDTAAPLQGDILELPQRLFRGLPNRGSEWTEDDYPLPLLKYLYNHPSIPGPFIDWYEDSELRRVGEACFLPLLSFLLTHCMTVTDGRTPLIWAITYGHNAVVKLLLVQDDIDVNSMDVRGRTPLSRAVSCGREEVAKLLLARDDIDENPKNLRGRTPLSVAALRGHEGMVKLLLARDDIDVNSEDTNHWTPLDLAYMHKGVAKLLLARGGHPA